MTTNVHPRMIEGAFVSVNDYGTVPLAEGAGGTITNDIFEQAQADVAARGGGIVYVPPAPPGKYYRTDNPLYGVDEVELLGGGPRSLIYNDRVSQTSFSDQACWLWGNQTFDFDQDRLTHYDINDVTSPTDKVTTFTAADAGNFTAGDVIVVLSGAHYDNGVSAADTYHYYLMTRVLSANPTTGVIVLERPINTSLATTGGRKPSIINPNETGVVGWLSKQIFTTYRAGLRNIAFKTNNQFSTGGGGLECYMDHVWIDGNGPGSCVGGNRMALCSFENLWTNVWRKFTEVKLGSHDNIFKNIWATYKEEPTPAFAAQMFMDFGEGSRDNLVDGFNADFGPFVPEDDPIGFFDTQGNLVKNGIIRARAADNRLVSWVNGVVNTPDDPPCANNVVDSVKFYGGADLQQYWLFSKASGAINQDNGARNCEFYGSPTVRAGSIDGPRNFIEECYHEDDPQSILLATTTTSCRITGNDGLGNFTPSSNGLIADLAANKVFGNDGDIARKARGATIRSVTEEVITSTTVGNDITDATATFPATALIANDEIEFEILGTIAGTTAAKTVRIADDTGALVTATIAAGDTGSFSIKGTVSIRGQAEYTSFFTVNPANTGLLAEVSVDRAGLDLATNGRVFTPEAYVTNAADSITINSVKIDIRKPGFTTKVA